MRLTVKGDAVRFEVYARPRSRRSRLVAVRDGRLEVCLAAQPVDGAANDELVATLARALSVRRSDICLVRGESARTKLVEIVGLSEALLRHRIGLACEP